MATEVTVTGGTSISVSLNKNVLTTVETQGSSVSVTQATPAQTVVSSGSSVQPLIVNSPASNKISLTSQVSREVSVQAKRRNQISVVTQGVRGLPGPAGADGQDGQDGQDGILALFYDPDPTLGAPLDVNGFNIFTSVEGGDVTFTPSSTGHINLNGTVFFKEFEEAPEPFEGGMYRDSDNNLYFGC